VTHQDIRRRASAGDDEITPQSSEAPEQLPIREVRRIEDLLGRKRGNVEVALAARFRNDAADPYDLVAQLALDVHDLKKPVSLATKAVFAALAAITGAAIYVGSAIWSASERNTSVEYRLRSCESRDDRMERVLFPPYQSNPAKPQGTGP
jgi:hypothetical protein